ncbi:hypothetical protein ORJ66_11380 [Pseudoalteromonas tunicata]|uniref:hypothetical protein n=1 Tax=Pseudoalteromonas tunicata TaxID=314281 RepID=UPI00273E129E|nr:hypothetical protein [Pseudoalteromonas tunicata]MDP5213645.1 hypothetical protein [Pseudoalteromonas tunicata]
MYLKRFKLASLVCTLTLLTACNSEIDKMAAEQAKQKDNDHKHETISSKGRLAISHAEHATLSVFELDKNQLLDTFNTTHIIDGLYASPGLRYAVAVQRANDLVEFIDGGLYQEDHGDHDHSYQTDPSMISFNISQAKPTHFDVNEDRASLFIDGDNSLNIPAGFLILDDHAIEQGKIVAEHTFENAMHGTAQLREDFVLTTHRSEAATNTLPDFVDLYHQHGDHFHQEQRFELHCPSLHGSAQNQDHIAFGCSDGVLVVRQSGENFTNSKIANLTNMPAGARIGSLKSSHDSPLFIGNAQRNYFYLIDPENQQMSEITWRENDSISVIASIAEQEEGHLYVIDSEGYLSIFAAEEKWQVTARFKVLSQTDDTFNLAYSHADETLFIAAKQQQKIIAVDLHDQKASTLLELDFEPNKITWLGIAQEHDH